MVSLVYLSDVGATSVPDGDRSLCVFNSAIPSVASGGLRKKFLKELHNSATDFISINK